jgi:hypothetical protein
MNSVLGTAAELVALEEKQFYLVDRHDLPATGHFGSEAKMPLVGVEVVDSEAKQLYLTDTSETVHPVATAAQETENLDMNSAVTPQKMEDKYPFAIDSSVSGVVHVFLVSPRFAVVDHMDLSTLLLLLRTTMLLLPLDLFGVAEVLLIVDSMTVALVVFEGLQVLLEALLMEHIFLTALLASEWQEQSDAGMERRDSVGCVDFELECIDFEMECIDFEVEYNCFVGGMGSVLVVKAQSLN